MGTNRYSYSFNDPVNLRDPGGNDISDNDAASLLDVFEGEEEELPGEFEHIDLERLMALGLGEVEAEWAMSNLNHFGGRAVRDRRSGEFTIWAPNTDGLLTRRELATNLGQPPGLSSEYAGAILAARNWSAIATAIGADLSFVGHSQGGGQATAMAMAVGNENHMQAVTFNPSTVSSHTIRRHSLNSRHPSVDIQNYIVIGEALTIGRLIGNAVSSVGMRSMGISRTQGNTTYLAPPIGVFNPITLHGWGETRNAYNNAR